MKPTSHHGADDVPPDRRPLLERFAGLLTERAVPLGFVARSDAGDLWDRHVVDSLRGLRCLPDEPTRIADIGSGAGLPGVPIAIARPDCRVTLIEPRSRRAAFLELVVETLALGNVEVTVRTAAEVPRGFDVALGRAFAGPAESWAAAEGLLQPVGRLVYWAGRSWAQRDPAELSRAGLVWEICAPASFNWQGPVVTMARGVPDMSEPT